ncbi:MAG: hypothetical protein ABR989_17270 [Candidatus Binatus soli]
MIVGGEIGSAITHRGCKGTKRPEIFARFMLSHLWSAVRRIDMSKRDAAIFVIEFF